MPVYEHFAPFAKQTNMKINLKTAKEDYKNAVESLKGFVTGGEFSVYNKYRKLSREENSITKIKLDNKWNAITGKQVRIDIGKQNEITMNHYVDAIALFYEYFKMIVKRTGCVQNMYVNIHNGDVANGYTNFKDWKDYSLELLEIVREMSELNIDRSITATMWHGGQPNEGYYLYQSKLIKEAMEGHEHRCFVFMLVKSLKVLAFGSPSETEIGMKHCWDTVCRDDTPRIKRNLLLNFKMLRDWETEDPVVFAEVVEVLGESPWNMYGEMVEDSKSW